jgi:hypothetical protein
LQWSRPDQTISPPRHNINRTRKDSGNSPTKAQFRYSAHIAILLKFFESFGLGKASTISTFNSATKKAGPWLTLPDLSLDLSAANLS